MITNLFQDMSPTLLAVTLAVLTGGVVLVLLGLGAANPILLRMGLRNMTRRPSQSLVLLCGLALSTAVMTASFGLSDSIAASEVQQRLARMGTVDESITGPFTQAQVDTTLAQLRQDSHVAAASALFFAPQSPTVTLLRTGLSVHDVDLYAVPPDFDQVYGAITDSRERLVHFADLRPNEVLVSATLAENLHIQPGDTLQLSFEPSPSDVRAVLSKDIAVTAGEAVGNAPAEVILPLAHAQQIDPEPPDTISIKNRNQGVSDGGSGQAVIHLLQQLFPGASASLTVPHALGTTEFDAIRIHPLKPDVVERTTNLLQINKLVFLSSIGQQFSWLPPTFTWLLVGAGMLLLILLVILLATERRAELGISRAVGLQRGHLVQLLLFEGCGYAVIAALFGLFLGIGATALELSLFSLLPRLGVGEAGNAVPISVITVGSLHLSLTWQSGLAAGCLGILTTMLTMLATALWISRITIVTAIRDLDAPPAVRLSLISLARALMRPPADTNGKPLAETPARLRARQVGALLGLGWGLWQRGPLCLLAGGILFAAGSSQETGWLKQLGAVLFIAGVGLLVQWIGTVGGLRASLVRRLAWSLIGGGWLVYALLSENTFLSLFQPVVDFTGAPSTLELLLSMLVPVVGAVILVMTNADLLGALITLVLRGFRGLAPISRTSLVYPLTFRFRSGVSVALLCLISFLVLFLVTTNVGAIQEAQAATNSGGFQLEATVFGSQLQRYPALPTQLQGLQQHTLLSQDFAAVGLLQLMYDYPESGAPQPLRLDLPGQPDYPLSQPPLVADEGFLASVTMPLYARAQGFASDQQIWNAVRTHPGDAVIQYDSRLASLPTSNGFAPFTAEIPDSSSPSAHDHPVTIIGLMPASTPWRVLLSLQTAGTVVQPPAIQFINTYLFRLRSEVSEEQAGQDLSRTLQTALRGITVRSLDQGSLNGVTGVFTVLLVGYLALGLIFGVLAIGVIASRAVVERRQQIGMLRALGFSRALVRRSFFLESGAVITLGLLTGATLALWLATQVARATYQDLPLPLFPIALLFLGSFLAALASTAPPAQGAARLPPAEALRYE